jgi:hypothetical protein
MTTECGIIVPELKIVRMGSVQWHAGSAAELLRDWVKEEMPSRYRKLYDRILLMAGSKSDYLEAAVKNEVLGAVAFAAPANVFFGLWGTASSINDASNGGTAGEVSGGSYDRVTKTNNTTNFASVTTGNKVNTTAITFPTASANWNASANINQVGVLDGNAKTSGDNLLLWGDLTVPKPVLNGDTASFAASAFSWSED